eukprot:gene27174-3221_t
MKANRVVLDEQLRLLRSSYSTADFDAYADDDEEDAAPIPPRTISNVVKKLNIKLREGIQTTMGRQAQRAILEQLEAAGTLDTSTQLDLAGLEVGGGGGSGVGGDLSLYPEEWGGAGGGKAAAAAYSKLRAHVFALEQSLVASKARLHTLEGLKVPGWSEAGALAMHHGVSVQSEVNRAEKLLGLLRDLHAKKK